MGTAQVLAPGGQGGLPGKYVGHVDAGLLGQCLLVLVAGCVQCLPGVGAVGVGAGPLSCRMGVLQRQIGCVNCVTSVVGQRVGCLLQQRLPAGPLLGQQLQSGVLLQPLVGVALAGVSICQRRLLMRQQLVGLRQLGAGAVLGAGGRVMKRLQRGDPRIQRAGSVQCGSRVGLGLLGQQLLAHQVLQALVSAAVRGVSFLKPGVGQRRLLGCLRGLPGQSGHVANQWSGGLNGLHALECGLAVGAGQLLRLCRQQVLMRLDLVRVQGCVAFVPAQLGFQRLVRGDVRVNGSQRLRAFDGQQSAGVIRQRGLVGKAGFN